MKWVALKRAVCLVGTKPPAVRLPVRPSVRQVALLRLSLLRQKHRLDVRQNAALSDGDARQKLVQLLVVANRQLQVTRDDPRLLVVASSVTCQLEYFGSQVLHDGRQVDGRAGADALRVVSFTQVTMDSTDGKLQAGARRAGLALPLRLASFAATGHDARYLVVYYKTV